MSNAVHSLRTPLHQRDPLRSARLWDSLAIAALVAMVGAVQFVSGAFLSDFASDADEPGHVVSSLLIRDYIAAGLPHHPLEFAEVYYVHYPKVAIGHWPPLLYACEAVWMLAFGRTRAAMLGLVTLASIALLVSVYLWVRRECGVIAGLLAAFALAAPAIVQMAMGSVAPNIFLALLAFWAAAAYGSYLETGRWRYAVWFAVFVLAAVGIHGRGAALVFIPVFAPLFAPAAAGRRTWMWRAAGVLAAFALLVLAPRFVHQIRLPSLHDAAMHARQYIQSVPATMSWPVVILALVGASSLRFLRTRWIAMPAAVLGCWIFHSMVNVPFEDRYLITAAPAIAALFGAGIHFFVHRLASGTWRRAVAVAIVVIASAAVARNTIPLWRKPDPGFHRFAAELTRGNSGILLVAGDAVPEGAFIAEIALHDRREDHIVLRASKMLANINWNFTVYQMLFSNPRDVDAFLDQLHVTTVMVAFRSTHPHIGQLIDALTGDPQVWKEVPCEQQSVRRFQRIGPIPTGAVHIRIPIDDKYFQFDQ